MIFYIHPRNNTTTAAYVKIINSEFGEELPSIGNFNLIYKENGQYLY
jgi:hypothetical protein